MSSNLPPFGPPSGPPNGPPNGPPSGPPPGQSGGPVPGPWGSAPEFLDSGYGGPVGPSVPPSGTAGKGKRRGLILGGGAVVGLAAVAGGAFAVYQLAFATGPQAAEALPASTVGYVSFDLDPSGKQKVEALETLKKIPAFDDSIDLDSDDDLRAKFFEYVEDEGVCPGLDYDEDIEPWLGQRFAIAGVDVGEELAPDSQGIAPVGVIAITDADQADAGLKKIMDCASESDTADSSASSSSSTVPSSYTAMEPADPSDGTDDTPEDTPDDDGDDSDSSGDFAGWSIQGDWVVIAETTEIAEAVTDAAQDDPLSEDDDYQKWTEAAGDPGIVTAYAAPEAGAFLAEAADSLDLTGYEDCVYSSDPVAPSSPDPYTDDDSYDDESYDDSYDDGCSDSSGGDDEMMSAIEDTLKDFDGAAMTLRFDDGGFELESASSVDYLGLEKIYGSDGGDDVVSGLPDDTAIALGVGFDPGWFTEVTDYLESFGVDTSDIDEGMDAFEDETGLVLPDDAETLLGESIAVAIGGDVDFSASEPTDQPVGVKVKGDPGAITPLLDTLLQNPDVADELDNSVTYRSNDDHVAAGFSDEWNDRLLAGGDLGDSDDYRDVVKESDGAAGVLYVNFNEGDWLTRAVGDSDQELLDNLEPLKALGMSTWTDGDISHGVIRLTLD